MLRWLKQMFCQHMSTKSDMWAVDHNCVIKQTVCTDCGASVPSRPTARDQAIMNKLLNEQRS